MRSERGSLAGRLAALAVGIALVGLAVRFTVQVLVSVWVPLVLIAGGALAVAGVIAFLRRSRGW